MTWKSKVRYWTRFCPKYCWAVARVGTTASVRIRSERRSRDLIDTSTGRSAGPEHRGIAPELLQTIEGTRLRMEQVDHDIHEIEQHPAALGQSFGMMRAGPQGVQRPGHRIRETADMGVRCPARDHEPVGRIRHSPEVEHHHIVPFEVGQRLDHLTYVRGEVAVHAASSTCQKTAQAPSPVCVPITPVARLTMTSFGWKAATSAVRNRSACSGAMTWTIPNRSALGRGVN